MCTLMNNKDDIEALYKSVDDYLNSGRWEEAEESLRTILKLDPNNEEAWNDLGLVLGVTRRYEEAVEALRKTVELKPDFQVAWSNLGKTLNALGLWEECAEAFLKALELDSSDDAVVVLVHD